MKDIPLRKDVAARDRWNLASLFAGDADWEAALKRLAPMTAGIVARKGTLGASKENLATALCDLYALEELAEDLGCYASLLTASDEGESRYQDMESRFMMAASKCGAETAFFTPELQAIPEADLTAWLGDALFDDYRIAVQKIRRLKDHVLSEKEERILALQSESAQTAQKAFSMLENVDLTFGSLKNGAGETLPLTQSTFSVFLEDQDREVRKAAYTQFYGAFDAHKHTIAALYEGSVNQDIFEARARGYGSSLDAALFPNKVNVAVYENLVAAVRANLAPLHRYYSLRKSLLGVSELRHYDVYVPLVASVKSHTPYDAGVEVLREALAPLGTAYTDRLCAGLLEGWADRYENKGKRSGAFSSGTYKSDPYILLNYKEDILRDLFTMAHEGGHSMHSWYSAHANPFPQYGYTIFEAEVASTFNEQLLFDYLLKQSTKKGDAALSRYLVATRVNDILATLYRQTMFAEFELTTHRMVEAGTPLTVESLRETYRALLVSYFGPEMHFEETSDLEGLRIPHFYNAFYVYKYATGISAALALAERVTNGGPSARDDYFAFLKSGGSRYPIESLRLAGVDMETPEPVNAALGKFAGLVEQLEMR